MLLSMFFKVSGWPVLGHFLCFKNIAFVKVTFLNRIEERVLIHSCASSSLGSFLFPIYLFLTVLGLHCCMGYSLVAIYLLLSTVASLVVQRRL